MRTLLLNIILVIFFTFQGCQKANEFSTPKNVKASQGTYINSVVVSWDPVENASSYAVYYTYDNSKWHTAGGSRSDDGKIEFIDDSRFSMDWDTYLSKKTFVFKCKYRVCVSFDEEMQSESVEVEGYSADYLKPNITSIARSADYKSLTVIWTDENPVFLNEVKRNYNISILDDKNKKELFYYSGTNLNYKITNRTQNIKYKVIVSTVFEYSKKNGFGNYYNNNYVSIDSDTIQEN